MKRQIKRRVRAEQGLYQTLAAPGAITLTEPTTRVTTSDAAQALTLANGKYVGQRKRVIHGVDSGSAVITAGAALLLADSVASITFTNVYDWVELEWNGDAWAIVGYYGVTIA